MRVKENCWLITKPIAHRGLFSDYFPENSIPAYQNAIDNGYAIETDVFLSKDGALVCVHDDNLFRLTGKNELVYNLTLKEIKSLSLLGTNQKIPTLKETLSLCENKTPLLIEIKNQPSKKIVEKVLEELNGYKGEFAIQSFNPLYIIKLKKLAPSILRGILSSKKPDTKNKFQASVVKNMPLNFIAKPDFISYEHIWLPLNKRKTKDKIVLAWTVTNNKEHEKAKPYCNNIIFENFIP